jgi:eukaryotic-like serine/threonine-protein kinase
MSSELEKQSLDIVFELVEADPDHRASLREKLCGGDQQLAEIVERLWRSHQQATDADFLNKGAMDDATPSLLQELVEDGNHPKSSLPPDGKQVPIAGRFVSMEILGQGGQGDVWKAIDPDLNREVALKVLGEARRSSASAAQRFRREAAVTGMLEHPNIVPIYEAGKIAADGSPYYVMRVLREKNLQVAIDEFHANAVSDETYLHGLRILLERFVDVCDAVAYAHSRGVIHRDLKPANIMLGDFGETLVVDWGLARVLKTTDAAESHGQDSFGQSDVLDTNTIEGTITGSPYFMSPEQARGEVSQLTEATDIYSLGAILFVILTACDQSKRKFNSQQKRRQDYN